MSSPQRDSPKITSGNSDNDPPARVFRAYLRARRSGDNDQSLEQWEEFVLMSYPMMRNKVAGLVGRNDLRWLSYDDVDDVSQEAFLRAKGMALTFGGQATGQARAALIKTATHTVLDHQRRQDVRRRDVAGSIDEQHSFHDGSTGNKWENRASGTEDWTVRASEGELELDRIVQAIDQIPSEDQRKVLLLTWQGYESQEIAALIGKKQNNVDQLRGRGLKNLKELLIDA